MESSYKKISYTCKLCPDIRKGLGPYEVAQTNQLKNHMIRIHFVDESRTLWDKYFQACKREFTTAVDNLGSNFGVLNTRNL